MRSFRAAHRDPESPTRSADADAGGQQTATPEAQTVPHAPVPEPPAEPSVPTVPTAPPLAAPVVGDGPPPPPLAGGDAGVGAPTGTAAGAPPVTAPGHVTPDGLPKLTRRRDGAILGGVAGGVADHLHVPVLWVRTTFVLLALTGAGVLAYALLWIFVPQRARSAQEPPAPASSLERQQAIGIAAVGVALLIAATALGLGPGLSWVLVPLGLAAVGGAFIWREADDARRARWRRTAAGIVGPSKSSLWRLIGGCVLVIGGLAVFALGQLDFNAVRSALIAVLLTLVGVAIITIPWWLRLVRDLGDERRGRIQERERAEIAAHLHDSVLQTLALIQRQPGDAREVQRLARSQERQLRTWLYGPAGYASAGEAQAPPVSTLAVALSEAAGEVEDTYAIAVTPVIVGDVPMDQHLAALVAAAREAMVNAAKHAGVQEVSVYAEVEDGTASVFVRDRGSGFDPAAVGADRRGLADSIRGRMERHGGTATVRSTPGEGTEIELSVSVSSAADSAQWSADQARQSGDLEADQSPDGSDDHPADPSDDSIGERAGVAGGQVGGTVQAHAETKGASR